MTNIRKETKILTIFALKKERIRQKKTQKIFLFLKE
jgi:hypothetical protein